MAVIEARMVIEIMGKPAQHVSDSLAQLVQQIGSGKGVSLITKNVHEPVQVKDSKDLYTSFAEIELGFDAIGTMFSTIFTYMPSHFEIISPSNFKMSNEEMTSLANLFIGRLHYYDSIAKQLVGERAILVNKLKQHGLWNEKAPAQAAQTAPKAETPKKKAKKSKKR